MVSQKGFNPKPRKCLEHVDAVTWIQTCLSCAPSPAWGCSACLGGTCWYSSCTDLWWFGALGLLQETGLWVIRGEGVAWNGEEWNFHFSLDFCRFECELTIVWSGNAGKGEDRVRELWTSGQTREEAEQQDWKRQCLIVICQPGCAG